VNWINIVKDLKIPKAQAWEKLKETHENAHKVKEKKATAKKRYQLKSKCFAQGLKQTFMENYSLNMQRILKNRSNPRDLLKDQLTEMSSLLHTIEDLISKLKH
jgi:hypothetical protein